MAVKNRIFYYDFLRAMAIVLVILCHIAESYDLTTASFKLAIPLLLEDIGHIGVPIFLMLSGALLLNREFALGDFFQKRFKRILYPAVFWLILNLIAGIIFLHWDETRIVKVILGTPSPFWFVWMIIGVYLFVPVINSFLKEYGLKGLKFFLIIWLVTVILRIFNLYPFYNLELSYFAGYIGFFIAGYYFDNKCFNVSDKTVCYLSGALFIISTIIHMMCTFYNVPIFASKYHNILIVVQSISLFLFIKYLDNIKFMSKNIFDTIKNNLIGKIIISVSICSYGMFLSHYFIYQYIRSLDITSLKFLPLFLIIVVFLSWLVTFIVSKLPVLAKLSGVK